MDATELRVKYDELRIEHENAKVSLRRSEAQVQLLRLDVAKAEAQRVDHALVDARLKRLRDYIDEVIDDPDMSTTDALAAMQAEATYMLVRSRR